MTDLGAGRVVELGKHFVKRARRYDLTFTIIEAGALIAATLLMGVGGLLYGNKPDIGLPCFIVGAVALVLNVVLIIMRQRGAAEHVASAMALASEAGVMKAEASASEARVTIVVAEKDQRISDLTGEREALTAQRDTARSASEAATERARVAELQQSQSDRALKDRGDELHKLIRAFDNQRNHRERMLLAFRGMQEAAARCAPDMPLRQVIESMVDVAYIDVIGAFGCAPTEKWTFSIFSREEQAGGDVMVRSFARSWDRKEEHDKRVWGRGEGFTGVAWEQRDPVVESDITKPGVAELYRTEQAQPSDIITYVSVAAIPIIVPDDAGELRVCGCITATSDKIGRFLRDQSDPSAQNLGLIYGLERIIAAQIALRRHQAAGAFKLPQGRPIGS